MPPRHEDEIDLRRQDMQRRVFTAPDLNDPAVQVLLLAQRVETLGREKEAIERQLEATKQNYDKRIAGAEARIAKMEKSFNMGAGMLILLPVLGTVVGIVITYAKTIFRPWTGG